MPTDRGGGLLWVPALRSRVSDTEARFEVLGWPSDGPTLRLDHREFAYAGKFVMSGTGKAVLRPTAGDAVTESPAGDEYDHDVLAAVSFDADRTDPRCLVLRYVTVRRDRRGEGLGPALVLALLDRVEDGAFDRARIAVNNPFAYEALYRAGFSYTGERSGLAEVVLERPLGAPADPDPERYRAGLDAIAERELAEEERAFLRERRQSDPATARIGVDVDVDDEGDDAGDGVEGSGDADDG